MSAVHHWSIRLLRALSALCLAAVFAVMLLNSVQRYGLGKSFVWGEEFVVYVAIYGAVFAAALAYLEGAHVRFTAVILVVPEAVRARLLLLSHAIVAAVGAGMAWSGVELVVTRGSILSSGLGMPMYYALAAMPLGGVLVGLAALLRLAMECRPATQRGGKAGA